jgi:hypothetical protein
MRFPDNGNTDVVGSLLCHSSFTVLFDHKFPHRREQLSCCLYSPVLRTVFNRWQTPQKDLSNRSWQKGILFSSDDHLLPSVLPPFFSLFVCLSSCLSIFMCCSLHHLSPSFYFTHSFLPFVFPFNHSMPADWQAYPLPWLPIHRVYLHSAPNSCWGPCLLGPWGHSESGLQRSLATCSIPASLMLDEETTYFFFIAPAVADWQKHSRSLNVSWVDMLPVSWLRDFCSIRWESWVGEEKLLQCW